MTIKQARESAGLTQVQAAALVGVALRTWCYWEREGRRMPTAAWELFLIKTGVNHD